MTDSGAAALIVVRRQVPSDSGHSEHMVQHFGIVVAHCQQRALGAGGNAVVLSMIFTRMPSQERHANADILHALGSHQIRRQRVAKQIGNRHLWVVVLHRAAHLFHRIAGQYAHQIALAVLPRPGHPRTDICAGWRMSAAAAAHS